MKHPLRLALVTLVTLFTLTAFASAASNSGSCGENVTWTYNSATATLTLSGTGAMEDYTYQYLDKQGFVCDTPWYDYRRDIKSVAVKPGVTSIGDYAFKDLYSLTSITLPKGLTSIGDSAFNYCEDLSSLTVPEGVTSIGESAFFHCTSLTDLTLPSTLTSIGASAFEYCSYLPSVTIPEGVTAIGEDTFYQCTYLLSVTLPSTLTSVGEKAFYCCKTIKSITIPEGVTAIGNSAFDGCAALQSITIPESVTSIGNSAFNGCSALQIITLPASLTSIGERTFFGCAALTGITIPASVTDIGAYAFQSCTSLTSIAIPDGITAIKDHTFYYCQSLKTLTVPRSLASVGVNAFYACYALETVTYGGTREDRALISIDERNNDCFTDAHWDCIPSTFGTCGSDLTWVLDEATGTLTVSGSGAMEDYDYRNPAPWNYYAAAITSAVMEEGVTAIGDRAFDGCVNLTAVTLPKSLTAVGESAFLSSCYLADVRYGGSEENRSAITLEEGNTWLNMARWTYAVAPNLTVTDVRFVWDDGYPHLYWTAPAGAKNLRYRVYGTGENGKEVELYNGWNTRTNLIGHHMESAAHIAVQTLDENGTVLGETGDTGLYLSIGRDPLPAPETARILPREDGTLAYEVGPFPHTMMAYAGVYSGGNSLYGKLTKVDADGMLRWEDTISVTLNKIDTQDLWIKNLTVFEAVTDTDDGMGVTYNLCACTEKLVQLKEPAAPGSATVTVTVPVTAGAEVTFGEQTAISDGQVSFTVSKGVYDLVATKPGCLTYTLTHVSLEQTDATEMLLNAIELLPGDLNGDDKINMGDLRTFLGNFNKTGDAISEPLADFNADAKVNMSDLRVFLSNFNKTAEKDCTHYWGV